MSRAQQDALETLRSGAEFTYELIPAVREYLSFLNVRRGASSRPANGNLRKSLDALVRQGLATVTNESTRACGGSLLVYRLNDKRGL